jgi:phosphatidylserine/phosphatidylglycerophosphate/cardiolipin synthase-like enzyme
MIKGRRTYLWKMKIFHPLKASGLIHQKILVIDKKMVFIGSANMTKTSLLMHNNLVIGFYSPKIAKFLMEKTPFEVAEIKSSVGGQKLELFLLPNKNALERIKKIITRAKEKIKIAMFTFTNMELIEELIYAKKRGVQISVVVDYNSAIGTSKEAVEKLKKENIKIMLSQGIQLLHHKYLYVDDKTLVCGSANWTKAAFKKNKDLVLIMNLVEKQKKFMSNLQKIIEEEAIDF